MIYLNSAMFQVFLQSLSYHSLMSNSSSSSSKSKMTLKKNHYNLSVKKIKKIQIYDSLCQTLFLSIIGANHCYAIITLQDNSVYKIERSAKQFSFSTDFEQNRIKYLIGSSVVTSDLTLIQLENKCNNSFAGRCYNVIENNCYDFVAVFCEFLNLNQLKKKVLTRKKQIIEYCQFNTYKKYKQQASTKLWLNVCNQALSLGLATSKTVRTTELVTATLSKLITPVGISVTIAAQAISEVAQMNKNNFQAQSVKKGLVNIAVGSVGSVGGGIGGGMGGAAIGTAIMPGVGTAVGYIIGMTAGGITGGWAAKKLLPWNWK